MDAVVVGQPEKPDRRLFGHAEEIDLLRELLTRGRAEALDSLRALAIVELNDVVDRVESCSPLVLDLRVATNTASQTLYRNQRSEPATCVANFHAVRDFSSGL